MQSALRHSMRPRATGRPVLRGYDVPVPRIVIRLVSVSAGPNTSKTTLIEEETIPTYDSKAFYPARIGEILGEKYRLISKLGWGTSSTVWLAGVKSWWPWIDERYVALKITNSTPVIQAAARKELDIAQYVSSLKTRHPGQRSVRKVLDSFEAKSPLSGRRHVCIAFEPLREPLWMLGRRLSRRNYLEPHLVKVLLPRILESLDFLHTECRVIHTDLKGDHFMLPFEDPEVLREYVRHQEAYPAPHYEHHGRPVYESRPNFGHLRGSIVKSVQLTDFGLAVRGDGPVMHSHRIQPFEYRAPEVMLQASWSYPADIWNLGLVLWELLADVNLLDGTTPDRADIAFVARFARMIRLLGPPPTELLATADKSPLSLLYDPHGNFKHPNLIPDDNFNLSNKTRFLEGRDRELFIAFARRMLAWSPQDRATAKELQDDPWLRT